MSRSQLMQLLTKQVEGSALVGGCGGASALVQGGKRPRGRPRKMPAHSAGGALIGGRGNTEGLKAYREFKASNRGMSRAELSKAWKAHKLAQGAGVGGALVGGFKGERALRHELIAQVLQEQDPEARQANLEQALRTLNARRRANGQQPQQTMSLRARPYRPRPSRATPHTKATRQVKANLKLLPACHKPKRADSLALLERVIEQQNQLLQQLRNEEIQQGNNYLDELLA